MLHSVQKLFEAQHHFCMGREKNSILAIVFPQSQHSYAYEPNYLVFEQNIWIFLPSQHPQGYPNGSGFVHVTYTMGGFLESYH